MISFLFFYLIYRKCGSTLCGSIPIVFFHKFDVCLWFHWMILEYQGFVERWMQKDDVISCKVVWQTRCILLTIANHLKFIQHRMIFLECNYQAQSPWWLCYIFRGCFVHFWLYNFFVFLQCIVCSNFPWGLAIAIKSIMFAIKDNAYDHTNKGKKQVQV